MATGGMFHLISEDAARKFITGLLKVKGEEGEDEDDDYNDEDDNDIDAEESDDEEEEEEEEEEPRVLDQEDKTADFETIFLNLCVLVKLLNSYKSKIDVVKYKELSISTYKLIRTTFPWAQVPGTQFNRKSCGLGYGLKDGLRFHFDSVFMS